ncbi:MAG: hypothetical protein ACRDTT_03420, partial [Pseudonocardiaceae bacterium]
APQNRSQAPTASPESDYFSSFLGTRGFCCRPGLIAATQLDADGMPLRTNQCPRSALVSGSRVGSVEGAWGGRVQGATDHYARGGSKEENGKSTVLRAER